MGISERSQEKCECCMDEHTKERISSAERRSFENCKVLPRRPVRGVDRQRPPQMVCRFPGPARLRQRATEIAFRGGRIRQKLDRFEKMRQRVRQSMLRKQYRAQFLMRFGQRWIQRERPLQR